METVVLKPGREKSLLRRHQWVFSGAAAQVPDAIKDGDTVQLADSRGQLLAVSSWSKSSQLAGRVWSFDPEEKIDEAFFRRRLCRAVEYRRRLGLLMPGGGCRIVASEADMLPGFIVDVYDNIGVVEVLSAGAERWKNTFGALLMEELPLQSVYERSDAGIRAKEGLAGVSGLLAGSEAPPTVVIEENGCRFEVDFRSGHKTGFYLDQRDNRAAVAALCAGKNVLNCFSYTGGFGVFAARDGAEHVVNVDSSRPALECAAHNFSLNQIPQDRYENLCGDVFSMLRKFRAEKRRFDLIILDPPKLVEGRKDLIRGGKAYKDMALVAYQLLNPGGILVNFSCSGLVSPELFQLITFEAALDAEVEPRILRHLEQAPDHPILLTQPETFYLKGLITAI